jgi:CO/xanthine dehydrogenase FAD-binding subunit
MTVGGATAVIHRPRTLAEAVEALAAAGAVDGGADLLAGGTDLVPALRSGARRARPVVALRRVLELRVRGAGADTLTVGSGVTYTDLAGWSLAPGLALAARVVGSPQIRNAGTVGGALGSANPRGDLATFLTAAEAEVLVASRSGQRALSVPGFLASGCRPGELVTAVRLPRPAGPQTYAKIGGRQAAYPALVSCALLVDRIRGRVNCAIGGIAAVPLRPSAAEHFAAAEVDWPAGGGTRAAADRFGTLVAEAAGRSAPAVLDGPLAPLGYRVQAAGVLAARAFARCLA